MAVGCFSRFWCCQQPPSPSDDAIETPVLAPMPPSSPLPIHIDPVEAKQHLARIERFRILVMGRANAGKTTILQRVCNTTDLPEILDGQGQKVDATMVQGSLTRGHHNIEDELVFTSNPGFVFHDSCGFEAGSEEQFDSMKKFVIDRAKMTKLDKRIHAIWFCIPLNESHRMVMTAENKFFNNCDTGHVPVIVLLTKADTLKLEAVQQGMDHGLSLEDAMQGAAEVEGRLQNSALARVKGQLNKQRFPPHEYLTLTGMEKEGSDCTRLITCTANALNEEGLQQLLISTQQSNLELCMEFAVMKALKNYMKMDSKMGPNALASTLALWFPYKFAFFERRFAERRFREREEARRFFFAAERFFRARERERERAARREEFAVDDQLVPDIQPPLYDLQMPTLSNSMQYSLQYTAEQGIGAILVLEYLYFLLQVKDQRNDLQVALDLAVDEYQTTGTRESVCKLINEAFQEHGENVEILCPILLQVAKAKQMSRTMKRKG